MGCSKGCVLAVAAAALLSLAGAGAAFAEGSSPGSGAARTASLPGTRSAEETAVINRRTAEDLYAAGWREVEKAKDEEAEADSLSRDADRKAAAGAKRKAESATRRLRNAASKFERATELAPDYHEAWNMLGFSLRRLGQTERAFEAYWRCLELKPDYAAAHEYLGEAYLQADNPDKAKAELAWLKDRGAIEADHLARSIEAWEQSHAQASEVPAR